jgi:tRNA dimethylallyltransferase
MTEQSPKIQRLELLEHPPAIFLMGPTASGKSHVALAIAQRLPVEIVSVDSAQVYRYMDIGTAKPGSRSLAAVPHHLINLIDPNERYSAAEFLGDALRAMSEITGRGNIPLLAGGTMLYFRTLLDGLSPLPSANSSLRAAIESKAGEKGWPGMHEELALLDPASAERIKPTDSQRIQRALEVCYLTDKPMSEILQQPKSVHFPYQAIRIALIPANRAALHQRIARRFDEMLKLGLIGEVSAVRDKFYLNEGSPSMRCVGYRQMLMYLDKKMDAVTAREKALTATRQLAKRQLTWLRSMRGIREFDCMAENLTEQVYEYLLGAGLKTAMVS